MHTKFTMVTPVRPGAQGAVRAALGGGELGDRGLLYPGSPSDPFGFSRIASLHFASFSLYDDAEDGWSLVFESNIDGEIGPYLDRLIEVAEGLDDGAHLLSIYRHCEGFEGGLAALRRYLRRHVVLPQAGFTSAIGLTRDGILLDARIHDVVDRTLGAAARPLAPEAAQAAVLEALDADPATRERWHAPHDAGTDLSFAETLATGAKLLGAGLSFLALAVVNLIPERAATRDEAAVDLDLRRSLELGEDLVATNHMLSVVHLHTDPGRKLAKRAAFATLGNLAALIFRKGFLGPVPTIHFAHWATVNDGRRLLFVSNYDGSWRSYLDDFTLKAAPGLNLSWAHSRGFPKTWAMLKGGAAKGPEFIAYARRSMVPTLVWYNAYPSLSALNVTRNRTLRAALVEAREGRGDTAWLELL